LQGDYSKYHETATSQENDRNESLTQDQADNILQTALDPSSPSLYQSCLQSQIFNTAGLQAAVRQATDDQVELEVRWMVPGNGNSITVTWTPSVIEGVQIPAVIPNGSLTIIVPRPKKATLVAANFGGFSTGALRLTPLPPEPGPLPQAPCTKLDRDICVACAGDFVGRVAVGKDYALHCPNMKAGRYFAVVDATLHIDNPIPGTGPWIDGNLVFRGKPVPATPFMYRSPLDKSFVFHEEVTDDLTGGVVEPLLTLRNCQMGADNTKECVFEGHWSVKLLQ
jgi:hypothetical protein